MLEFCLFQIIFIFSGDIRICLSLFSMNTLLVTSFTIAINLEARDLFILYVNVYMVCGARILNLVLSYRIGF